METKNQFNGTNEEILKKEKTKKKNKHTAPFGLASISKTFKQHTVFAVIEDKSEQMKVETKTNIANCVPLMI